MSAYTVETRLVSSPVYTSELTVQGKQQLNVSLRVLSAFSGTITLQRTFDNGTVWRDVETWAIATESISTKPEPETCKYRIGIKTGDYVSGEALARLGTS